MLGAVVGGHVAVRIAADRGFCCDDEPAGMILYEAADDGFRDTVSVDVGGIEMGYAKFQRAGKRPVADLFCRGAVHAGKRHAPQANFADQWAISAKRALFHSCIPHPAVTPLA